MCRDVVSVSNGLPIHDSCRAFLPGWERQQENERKAIKTLSICAIVAAVGLAVLTVSSVVGAVIGGWGGQLPFM